MTKQRDESGGGQLTIRPLRLGDIDAVMAIDAQSYATLWPRDLLVAEVELPDRYHLVGVVGDEVVTHGSLMFVVDEATLTTIAVDPAHRHRGYGAAMLQALLDEARGRAASAVTLEVRVGNDVAVRLYERFGFVVEGRRKRYYEPDGEDALIMWRRDLLKTDPGTPPCCDPAVAPLERTDHA